jgi:DNA-binding MarR family transcriptional regulator
MVKPLDDEAEVPPLIDHVGWQLWRAARLWKAEFDRRMAARQLGWCSGARAELIGALRQGPQPQSSLGGELGISKQAVQQFVDELATLSVVERRANAQDARSRLVALTAKGRKALAESNAVKRSIEAGIRKRLGARRFDQFTTELEALASGWSPDGSEAD